ncbi:MAG: hypothetical protein KDD01_13800 [Phaeodactylibacter sp.]|nr:hypothetical protein [Phaeodactylibacter sp.]
MRILIPLLLMLPLSLYAQSWFVEPGAAFRSGIWQYNLGKNSQGVYGGEGLHYSHFSPFLEGYLQGGYQAKGYSIGAGLAYTVFFDNELRVNQNQRDRSYIYPIAESFIQFVHVFIRGEWYVIQKKGFRLGPSLRAGFFQPTTGYPQQAELQQRRFIEGGLTCLARIGRPWLTISPAYQWNSITGKGTDARHHIFSLGILAGLRYLF